MSSLLVSTHRVFAILGIGKTVPALAVALPAQPPLPPPQLPPLLPQLPLTKAAITVGRHL